MIRAVNKNFKAKYGAPFLTNSLMQVWIEFKLLRVAVFSTAARYVAFGGDSDDDVSLQLTQSKSTLGSFFWLHEILFSFYT